MSLETQRPTDEAIDDFAGTLRGTLLQPDDEARAVWNGMIDKHPASVILCAGTAEVIAAVDFARAHDYPISEKGGGHTIAGRAAADDALMDEIDADLVVLGGGMHGFIDDLLTGHVARSVGRRANRPITVVPEAFADPYSEE